MADLNARYGTMRFGKRSNAGHTFNVSVIPNAQIAVGDTSLGRYACGFHHH
ncbi:hypothetical protein D3C71_2238790 [compost metagenome]